MQNRARRTSFAVGLAIVGLAATACATTVKPNDSDSGATCTEVCVGTLTLSSSDGSDAFSLTVLGDDFATLQIGCPDNIRAGGGAHVSAECVSGGVYIESEGLPFPETLTVAAAVGENYGDEQDITPEWTDASACGSTCNSATATFEMPPDGR